MSGNLAAKQNLAGELATVLRRFEHEGGSKEGLARKVGETPRQLGEWANGTCLPGHVLRALLGELPRHLANELIRSTGLELVEREADEAVNPLAAAASAASLVAEITHRMADGQYCHRDRAEVSDQVKPLIAMLQALVVE